MSWEIWAPKFWYISQFSCLDVSSFNTMWQARSWAYKPLWSFLPQQLLLTFTNLLHEYGRSQKCSCFHLWPCPDPECILLTRGSLRTDSDTRSPVGKPHDTEFWRRVYQLVPTGRPRSMFLNSSSWKTNAASLEKNLKRTSERQTNKKYTFHTAPLKPLP